MQLVRELWTALTGRTPQSNKADLPCGRVREDSREDHEKSKAKDEDGDYRREILEGEEPREPAYIREVQRQRLAAEIKEMKKERLSMGARDLDYGKVIRRASADRLQGKAPPRFHKETVSAGTPQGRLAYDGTGVPEVRDLMGDIHTKSLPHKPQVLEPLRADKSWPHITGTAEYYHKRVDAAVPPKHLADFTAKTGVFSKEMPRAPPAEKPKGTPFRASPAGVTPSEVSSAGIEIEKVVPSAVAKSAAEGKIRGEESTPSKSSISDLAGLIGSKLFPGAPKVPSQKASAPGKAPAVSKKPVAAKTPTGPSSPTEPPTKPSTSRPSESAPVKSAPPIPSVAVSKQPPTPVAKKDVTAKPREAKEMAKGVPPAAPADQKSPEQQRLSDSPTKEVGAKKTPEPRPSQMEPGTDVSKAAVPKTAVAPVKQPTPSPSAVKAPASSALPEKVLAPGSPSLKTEETRSPPSEAPKVGVSETDDAQKEEPKHTETKNRGFSALHFLGGLIGADVVVKKAPEVKERPSRASSAAVPSPTQSLSSGERLGKKASLHISSPGAVSVKRSTDELRAMLFGTKATSLQEPKLTLSHRPELIAETRKISEDLAPMQDLPTTDKEAKKAGLVSAPPVTAPATAVTPEKKSGFFPEVIKPPEKGPTVPKIDTKGGAPQSPKTARLGSSRPDGTLQGTPRKVTPYSKTPRKEMPSPPATAPTKSLSGEDSTLVPPAKPPSKAVEDTKPKEEDGKSFRPKESHSQQIGKESPRKQVTVSEKEELSGKQPPVVINAREESPLRESFKKESSQKDSAGKESPRKESARKQSPRKDLQEESRRREVHQGESLSPRSDEISKMLSTKTPPSPRFKVSYKSKSRSSELGDGRSPSDSSAAVKSQPPGVSPPPGAPQNKTAPQKKATSDVKKPPVKAKQPARFVENKASQSDEASPEVSEEITKQVAPAVKELSAPLKKTLQPMQKDVVKEDTPSDAVKMISPVSAEFEAALTPTSEENSFDRGPQKVFVTGPSPRSHEFQVDESQLERSQPIEDEKAAVKTVPKKAWRPKAPLPKKMPPPKEHVGAEHSTGKNVGGDTVSSGDLGSSARNTISSDASLIKPEIVGAKPKPKPVPPKKKAQASENKTDGDEASADRKKASANREAPVERKTSVEREAPVEKEAKSRDADAMEKPATAADIPSDAFISPRESVAREETPENKKPSTQFEDKQPAIASPKEGTAVLMSSEESESIPSQRDTVRPTHTDSSGISPEGAAPHRTAPPGNEDPASVSGSPPPTEMVSASAPAVADAKGDRTFQKPVFTLNKPRSPAPRTQRTMMSSASISVTGAPEESFVGEGEGHARLLNRFKQSAAISAIAAHSTSFRGDTSAAYRKGSNTSSFLSSPSLIRTKQPKSAPPPSSA